MGQGQLAGIPNWLKKRIKGIETHLADIAIPLLLSDWAENEDGTFTPQPDEREVYQVDEDVMIMTAWGEPAVCLKGSYIVVYSAEENDFNTVEEGAIKSTYRFSTPKQKKLS